VTQSQFLKAYWGNPLDDENKYDYLRMDASTHSLQVIEYEHHEIHAGNMYRVQHNDDAIPAAGSSGELVIAFRTADSTKLPHILWDFFHEGNMTMTVYEGVTLAAGGTDVTPKNSRRDSTNTSLVQGFATGALVSNRVAVGENSADSMYSGGSVISLKRNYAARNQDGGGGRRRELVLAPDTTYAFVLANNETSTQGGQIRLEWYEHTDKDS